LNSKNRPRHTGSEVLLLDDARGLEERRHEAKVGAEVDEDAVGEELVRVGPEIARELPPQPCPVE
jgi:hypothetical protein